MRNVSAAAPLLTRRKLYIAMVTASQLMLAGQSYASPEGGQVVGGAGNIDQSGKETIIRQQTERMAIDWKSFDVKADERVQFVQPGASSVALNRVISNKGSEILGRIDANGKVFLVNPNGVVFGKDSQINVGGILASGLSINPTDFMNGNFTLSEVEGAAGKVVNSGIINAATGGSVTLIGKEVTNDGLIIANLGAVNLAVGKEAVVTFDNNGLVGVKVTKEVLQSELGVDAALVNSGEINADGGRILLTASTSQDIFSDAVNHGGMNAATSVVVNDDGSFTLGGGADVVNTGKLSTSVANGDAGQIIVVGDKVTSSGTIAADSQTGNGGHIELNSKDTTILNQTASVSAKSNTNGKGGDVKILGDKVGLMDAANVNASGANGGGQVLIGGDETGKNKSINNANFIYLDENTNVKTDALLNGNGGKLITFAQDAARIYGNLSARGGSEGGNGGFIETSGLKGFEILNSPDISAKNGIGGIWLIDPYDLNISTNANQVLKDSDNAFTSTDALTNLSIETLQRALADNVTVKIITGTSGDGKEMPDQGNVTLSDTLNYNAKKDRGQDQFDRSWAKSTLIISAANNININADILRTAGGTGNLSIELNANTGSEKSDSGGIILAAGKRIETSGGSFKATGMDFTLLGNENNTNSISTNGGIVSLTMTGAVVLNGKIPNSSVQNSGTNTISTNGGDFTVVDSKGFDSLGAIISTSSTDHTGGGDLKITSTGSANNVKLGVLKFGYTQNSPGETANVDRIGTVDVNSEGNVILASDIEFNNTGARHSGTGERFPGNNTSDNPELKITAVGDITVDGRIFDLYGDARDALDIKLKSTGPTGVITINKAIYTSGGNFTAESNSFKSTALIDTDHANDGNQSGSSNAIWSNRGNVIITASQSVELEKIVTDRNINNDNKGVVEGNLVIQKRTATDNLKVISSSVLDIYGTTTFDLFGSGVGNADVSSSSINLTSATNKFNGNVLFTSAGNVTFKNNQATILGASNIKGTFDLTSTGAITQSGNVVVTGTTTIDAAGKSINLGGDNDFSTVNFSTSPITNLTLKDINALTIGSVSTNGGGTLGVVIVTADGALNTSSIITGADNVNGGNITLTSTNSTLNTGSLNASGGAVTGSNAGKSGGIINLQANSDISIGALLAKGGNASGSGAGGAGGNVAVNSTAGNITANSITTSGGNAAGSNSNGGAAGSIVLTANAASTNVLLQNNLTARGGTKAGGGQDGIGKNITFYGSVLLNSGVGINLDATGSTSGDIRFTKSLDSETSQTTALSVYGNSARFDANVGVNKSLGLLTVTTNSGNFIGGARTFNASSFNLTANEIYANTLNSFGGVVTLKASNKIDITKIDTRKDNGAGGNVNVNVGSTDLATVEIDGIDTSGVTDINTLASGYKGGNIVINGGDITLGTINVSGSNAVDGDGGAAGSITITATDTSQNGTPTITLNGDINAVGGLKAGVAPAFANGDQSLVNLFIGSDADSAGVVSLNFTNPVDMIITGGSGTDTLNGFAAPATWVIDGTNTLALTTNPNSKFVSFSSFENLVGGSQTDLFKITADFNGTIKGGGGADTFEIGADVTRIEGGAGDDEFTVTTTGNVAATLSGGGNNDVLTGANRPNEWVLGTEESLNTDLKFSGIKNINGNENVDTFDFIGVSAIAHNIDAKGNANDVVKVERDTTVSFVSGSELSSVLNAEVIHSKNAGKLSVESPGLAKWTFSGSGSSVTGLMNNVETVVKFTGFTSFIGGAGNDEFTITGAARVNGLIDGGGGSNTLDLSSANGDRKVEITTSKTSSNSLDLIVNNFSTITANATTASTLIHSSASGSNNSWIMSKDNAGLGWGKINNNTTFTNFFNLTGGDGADIFNFTAANGIISGTIDGAGGVNEIRAYRSNATSPLPNTWKMNENDSGSIEDALVKYVNKFVSIQKFAGAGADTMDYSGFTTGDAVVQIGGSSSGASGMTKFIGNGGNSQITGLNTSSVWQITGSGAGNVEPVNASSPKVSFEKFSIAIGGSGDDTFNLEGDFAGTIRGGVGNDTFKFTAASTSDVYGGVGDDTFDIGATVGKLYGSEGNDTFNLSSAGSATLVDGGIDTNKLVVPEVATVLDAPKNVWVLTSSNGGSVTLKESGNTSLVTLFESINILKGSGSDSLTGRGAPNIWTLSGKNQGTLKDSAQSSINFEGMGKLIGGLGTDLFDFSASNSAITIAVDGGDTSNSSNTIKSRDGVRNIWSETSKTSGSLAVYDEEAQAPGEIYVKHYDNIQITSGSGSDIKATEYLDLNDDLKGFTNFIGTNSSLSEIIGFNNVNNLWTITDKNKGSVSYVIGGNTRTYTFALFSNLTGGNQNDTFTFSSNGSVTGSVNGGSGGVNTIVGLNIDNNWQMAGANSGEVAKTATKERYAKFENIQRLTGGNQTDTLIGALTASVQNWHIDNSENIFFLDDQNANIKFAGIENIEGGAGTNTITNKVSNNDWVIRGENAGDISFNGTKKFGFSKIGNIVGSNSDTLKGLDQDNNWQLSDEGVGSVSKNIATPTDTLNFSGINKIIGGSGSDTFNVGASGNINQIEGGTNSAGAFDSLVSKERDNDWVIEADGTSKLYVAGNSGKFITFKGISNLTGGAFEDKFYVKNANQINGVFDGGTGTGFNLVDVTSITTGVTVGVGASAAAKVKIANINQLKAQSNPGIRNTLIADDFDGNIFTITGADSGTLDKMTFEGFGNLTGRQYADTFIFKGKNAKISGVINGGTFTGDGTVVYTDKVDLSEFENPGKVAMYGGAALKDDAINITNIESVVGNTSLTNTFYANDQINTWSVDGKNSGSVSNEGTVTPVGFSNFKILVGGAKDDQFIFTDTGIVEGYIDGGDHTSRDVVDLSKRTDKVKISLSTVADGYRNVELFIGNKTDSTMYGSDTGDTWNLTGANSGNVNRTVFFTDFTDFVGGSGRDIFNLTQTESSGSIFKSLTGGAGNDEFNLTQGRLLGSVLGGADNDTFTIKNAVIVGSIKGENGDDTLNVLLSSSSSETTRFEGGGGSNNVKVSSESGDTNTYSATHSSAVLGGGVLRYDVNNSSSRSINYSSVKEVNDSVFADTLSVEGTEAADIFSLREDAYLLNDFTKVTYFNKPNVVIAGAADDKVLVNEKIKIAKSITVKRSSIATSNEGEIGADELLLEGVVSAGSSDTRLKTNIGKLSINTSAGDIYIQEEDALKISSFNSNNKFDLSLNGNLTSDVELRSISEFNVATKTGNIILDKSNSLTGLVNLKAPGNITINNSIGIKFGNLTSDTLNVDSLGPISSDGIIKVGGLAVLRASGDIVLENSQNDFNTVSITNAQNVFLVDSGLLTLSTVGAIGDVKTQSQGIILNGAVNSGSLTINAGGGTANLANTVNAQSTIDIIAQNIVVAGNVDAKANVEATSVGDFSQSANISGANVELNVGRYTTGSNVITTATNGSVSIASASDITTKNISASADIILKAANDLSAGGTLATSGGIIDLLAGRNVVLSNDVNGQSGVNLAATNGSVQLQAGLNSAKGDVNVTAAGDVSMAANATTSAAEGNISYSGKNLTVTALSALNGDVTFKSSGSVNDANLDLTNISAKKFTVDAISGIGASDDLETIVSGLSLATQTGSIRIINTGEVTIDRMRANSNVYLSNYKGDVLLDNSANPVFGRTEPDALLAGGTMNSNYNLSDLFIRIDSGDLLMASGYNKSKEMPAIVANNAKIDIAGGNFGSLGAPIIVYVRGDFVYTASRYTKPVWAFGVPPANPIKGPGVQTSLVDLLSAGAEQLVVVEEINQINPAIFTNVRNYVYDDIAIMLPADQRYDDDSISSTN